MMTGNPYSSVEADQIEEEEKWIDQIEKHQRPKVYYKILDCLIPKSQGKIHYSENLLIPNYLRTSDAEMELHLINIQKFDRIAINSISSIDPGMVFLHLVDHDIHVQMCDNVINLPKSSSWYIKNATSATIISLHEDTKIAIEIIKLATINSDPRDEAKPGELPDSLYHPKKIDFSTRKSFLKKPMNLEEIRKKLIFIDAEFTVEGVSKWRTPLSVCILDYNGKVLLNKFITPRNRIIDFGTIYHGLKEYQTRGQWDEYEVIREIKALSEQKIIVGHDLQMELSHLGISKKRIYGIRDLVAAPVFKTMGIKPRGQGIFYRLQDLASRICGIKIQRGNHDSMSDVRAIWKIYKRVEFRWIDHVFSKKIKPDIELTESPKELLPSRYVQCICEKRKSEMIGRKACLLRLRCNQHQFFSTLHNYNDSVISKYKLFCLRNRISYYDNYLSRIKKHNGYFQTVQRCHSNFH